MAFRAAPRILELLCDVGYLRLGWVPHFSSVINWTLRLGLAALKQVKPVTEPWLAIVDTSIDIGVKKVLVVLRVSVAALAQRGSAVCLADCECIGLVVSEHSDGETVLMTCWMLGAALTPRRTFCSSLQPTTNNISSMNRNMYLNILLLPLFIVF